MHRHPLAKEISIALAAKLAALVALFVLCFGPGQRPDLDSRDLFEHLLGDAPPGDSRGGVE